MKRVVTPELLDEDLGSPEEIAATLLDLRSINQKLGGFSSMTKLLRKVAAKSGKRELTFLDVAGGTGDVAEQVSKSLARDGVEVSASVLDRAPAHMNGRLQTRVAGDALALPFAEDSFDVVGCNLFLHHLEPNEMTRFFHEALRVARVAVVVSDLRRNRFHWAAASLGRLIYRSRLTRNDAPASVRRAYTIPELENICGRSHAQNCDIGPLYFQRVGMILWK